jgi:hypothetical protein
VVDLNQRQFPAGEYDCIAMLELLEYMHDVPWLLARARQSAHRLICTYHPRAEEPAQRRQQGWFNDYTNEELMGLLGQAGWRVETNSRHEFGTLYTCAAT